MNNTYWIFDGWSVIGWTV